LSPKADLLDEVQLLAFKSRVAEEFSKLQVFNMDSDEMFEKVAADTGYTRAEFNFGIEGLVREGRILMQDGELFLAH
jgi:hypothetical protein